MSHPHRTLYEDLGSVAEFEVPGGSCLATVPRARPEIGALMWRGAPEALAAGEAWLRAQGCTAARGPMEMATWFPYRASLGPWEQASFFGEPREDAGPWRAQGYREVAWYRSALAEHAPLIARGEALGAPLARAGWRLEPICEGEFMDEAGFQGAVRHLHAASHRAFADAFGFSPIPEAALQRGYAPLRPLIHPRLVTLARAPSGAVAGFCLALPDPGTRRFLLKTLAVDPGLRRLGVGGWLVGHTHAVARAMGFSTGIHVLMADTSHSNAISKHGGRVFRRYALLEKAL